MIKIIILMRKKAGITREAFISYYENKHSRLVYRLKGIVIEYRRNYPLPEYSGSSAGFTADTENGASGLEYAGLEYDCITEATVADEEALKVMFEIMARPDVRAEIDEDEKHFIDQSSIRMFVCANRATDMNEVQSR